MYEAEPQLGNGNDAYEHLVTIPGESLFEKDRSLQAWPDSLLGDPAFVQQIERRKKLIDALHTVQHCIVDPTVSFEQHLDAHTLSEDMVAELYEALTDLLQNNPEYGRIILYLPFEYLLHADRKPDMERLARQSERLKNAYMQTWNRLLHVHDVRANFVDGDVLETEKRRGDVPRVVKAAHFIPFLVQKGWMTTEDILSLHATTDDAVLRESIADTFGVLREFGFLPEDPTSSHDENPDQTIEPCAIEPEELRREIDERLAQMRIEDNDSTEKRRAWLAHVHKENVIDAMSDEVRLSVEHDLLTDEVVELLTQPDAHPLSKLVLIDGVRKAIERVAITDGGRAATMYARFHSQLCTMWERPFSEIQPALETLFFRLHHAGVIDEHALHSLGLSVPSIGGPFAENLKHLEVELDNVQRVVTSMRDHPALRPYVYPVVLMYGSKLKGYGTRYADTDLGVFIKPATPDAVRADIREALQSIVTSDVLSDSVTEFWLEEAKDGLRVRDFESHDRTLGRSRWAHVLFGAAWSGDADAIRALHARLLPTYFLNTEERAFGRNVRELHIEHLEQDVLQYRLMHKGYRRYYPERGGLQHEHVHRMDGHGTFWDSGYRAIATKLFAEKVFLPTR